MLDLPFGGKQQHEDYEMHKYILKYASASLLALASFVCNAAQTTGGLACRSEPWFDDMMQFAAQEDFASWQPYFDANKCFSLKQGLPVTVTDWPGMFGGKTGFMVNGVKLWTYREAIDDE
jgi:hypothetical protein